MPTHHVPSRRLRRPVKLVKIGVYPEQLRAGENFLLNIRPGRIDLGSLKEEKDPLFTLDVHKSGTDLLAKVSVNASAIAPNLAAPLPTMPFHPDHVALKHPKQWDDKSEK